MSDWVQSQVEAALRVAAQESADPAERAEMLMEIALGLQSKPKSPEPLHAAVALYEKALDLCPLDRELLRARMMARMGGALQLVPDEGSIPLEKARSAYDTALTVLRRAGLPEEIAEAEMNFGLVLQSLAALGRARITDAIAAYQRALRTFDRGNFPQEFAILQNNLATAFLSIPFSDERAKMREALAVQAFEEGLKVVNLIDHPSEYAMLQNNLGNALQYAASAHPVENNLRALEAYAEALKVRTRESAPLQYANTISNLANCLSNLPDFPAQAEKGAADNLARARTLYAEAREIFVAHGEVEKAQMAAEAGFQIGREMLGGHPGDGRDVGSPEQQPRERGQ